jgi:hypothetical protein
MHGSADITDDGRSRIRDETEARAQETLSFGADAGASVSL